MDFSDFEFSGQDENDAPVENTGDGKLKKIELHRIISRLMRHGVCVGSWQKFPRHFRVIRDDRGDIDYCEVLPNQEVRYVARKALVDAIINYVENLCPHIAATTCSLGDVNEILLKFEATVTPLKIEDIKPVRQLSEDGLTFRRLPWDLTPGMSPTFDEFLDRTGNAPALMAWIGSLFFEKSDSQQYCYLFGSGRNGKGSLTRVLDRVFGYSFATEQPPAKDDRFWTSGLLGKRLVCFPDCNNSSFVTTGLFKSLTGGDRVRIERKNHQPYSTKLSAKFLFLSNDRPQLGSQAADQRRAIFCPVEPASKDFGAEYEALLWHEAPHFLYSCIQIYKHVCPNGNEEIPVDRSFTRELAEGTEVDMAVIFDRHFVAYPGQDGGIPRHRLLTVLKSEGLKSPFERRQFMKWLEIKYGSVQKQLRLGKDRVWVWTGIREKSHAEKIEFDVE